MGVFLYRNKIKDINIQNIESNFAKLLEARISHRGNNKNLEDGIVVDNPDTKLAEDAFSFKVNKDGIDVRVFLQDMSPFAYQNSPFTNHLKEYKEIYIPNKIGGVDVRNKLFNFAEESAKPATMISFRITNDYDLTNINVEKKRFKIRYSHGHPLAYKFDEFSEVMNGRDGYQNLAKYAKDAIKKNLPELEENRRAKTPAQRLISDINHLVQKAVGDWVEKNNIKMIYEYNGLKGPPHFSTVREKGGRACCLKPMRDIAAAVATSPVDAFLSKAAGNKDAVSAFTDAEIEEFVEVLNKKSRELFPGHQGFLNGHGPVKTDKYNIRFSKIHNAVKKDAVLESATIARFMENDKVKLGLEDIYPVVSSNGKNFQKHREIAKIILAKDEELARKVVDNINIDDHEIYRHKDLKIVFSAESDMMPKYRYTFYDKGNNKMASTEYCDSQNKAAQAILNALIDAYIKRDPREKPMLININAITGEEAPPNVRWSNSGYMSAQIIKRYAGMEKDIEAAGGNARKKLFEMAEKYGITITERYTKSCEPVGEFGHYFHSSYSIDMEGEGVKLGYKKSYNSGYDASLSQIEGVGAKKMLNKLEEFAAVIEKNKARLNESEPEHLGPISFIEMVHLFKMKAAKFIS